MTWRGNVTINRCVRSKNSTYVTAVTWVGNVTINQFCCGFSKAARVTTLSDPRQVSPDRVKYHQVVTVIVALYHSLKASQPRLIHFSLKGLLLRSQLYFLGNTIFGEIFTYVAVLRSSRRGSHIPAGWMVHAACWVCFCWMSGTFESVRYNACVHRLD